MATSGKVRMGEEKKEQFKEKNRHVASVEISVTWLWHLRKWWGRRGGRGGGGIIVVGGDDDDDGPGDDSKEVDTNAGKAVVVVTMTASRLVNKNNFHHI